MKRKAYPKRLFKRETGKSKRLYMLEIKRFGFMIFVTANKKSRIVTQKSSLIRLFYCSDAVSDYRSATLSIRTVPFFSPLAVASSVIWPGVSVEETMAVIIPLKTFIFGRWKGSKEVEFPLAPAR